MRKLLATTFMSADGVMQAPGGPDEDPSGGFTAGGWTFGFWDEVCDQAISDIMSTPFDLLLGRTTYDIFAGFWPNQADPTAEALNEAHHYVASNTLTEGSWAETTILSGDVPARVAELKQTDGRELQVHGSGALLQTLFAAGLVDELHLWIHPVLLGRGKRLFPAEIAPTAWDVTNTIVSTTGIVITTLVNPHPVVPGDFSA